MKNLDLNVKKTQLENGFFCAICYVKGFIDTNTIQQFEDEINLLF